MNKKIAAAVAALWLTALSPAAAQMHISNGQQTTVTEGLSPQPAMPAGNEMPPVGVVKSVTPVSACLDQLPPEEAAEVRARYLKPYQECQRRLQIHAIKRAKAGDQGDSGEEKKAESPRNFIRVQKDAAPAAAPIIGLKNSDAAAKRGKTPDLYNR